LPWKLRAHVTYWPSTEARVTGERTLVVPSNAKSLPTSQLPICWKPSGTLLPTGHGATTNTVAVEGYVMSIGPAPDAPKSSTVNVRVSEADGLVSSIAIVFGVPSPSAHESVPVAAV
jgi:hypothetical protein